VWEKNSYRATIACRVSKIGHESMMEQVKREANKKASNYCIDLDECNAPV
jgi:hypothetical protein